MKKSQSKTSGQPRSAGSGTSQTTKSAATSRLKPSSVVKQIDVQPAATGSHATRWTFLTNHSHVLILLSTNPSMVLRQVAIQVGITERAVQRIIADLEEADIIEREKVGRQNQYRIIADKSLRHTVESHRTIGDLLALMAAK